MSVGNFRSVAGPDRTGLSLCLDTATPRLVYYSDTAARPTENLVLRELSRAEINRHNALANKGWALTSGRLVLQGEEPSARPGWYTRWQLRRAIRCFEGALEINPEGWSSMWGLGKIHQRMGDQQTAFDWFARAHAIKPDQADVAREASIAAMDLGWTERALPLCLAAVASSPDDPGLVCNLALAHCLAGDDTEAERCVLEAAKRDSTDEVTSTVLCFIRDVASGKRKRPRSLEEAFPRDSQ